MDVTDTGLMKKIEEGLIRHGQLSILFYKMGEDWIIKKWGEYEDLSVAHKILFDKYLNAGFDEEAYSITLLELPKDPEVIYRILSGLSLENELKKLGVTI